MQGKRNSAKMAVTDIVKCVFLLQMFISRIGSFIHCPNCQQAGNIVHCMDTSQRCAANQVCSGTMEGLHVTVECGFAMNCNAEVGLDAVNCTGGVPFGVTDKCHFCCSDLDSCRQKMQLVQKGIDGTSEVLHCPTCPEGTTDPHLCLNNLQPCEPEVKVCSVEWSGQTVSAGCDSNHVLCRLHESQSQLACLEEGLHQDAFCTHCCTNSDCLLKALYVTTTAPTTTPTTTTTAATTTTSAATTTATTTMMTTVPATTATTTAAATTTSTTTAETTTTATPTAAPTTTARTTTTTTTAAITTSTTPTTTTPKTTTVKTTTGDTTTEVTVTSASPKTGSPKTVSTLSTRSTTTTTTASTASATVSLTSATSTPATIPSSHTTQELTTRSTQAMATSGIPVCVDNVRNNECSRMPGVCDDVLAHVLCPLTCGFCDPDFPFLILG